MAATSREHSRAITSGLIAIVLLIVSPAAFAQFTANIQGKVKDRAAPVLANVKVELVNTTPESHVSTTTTADGSGNYRFAVSPPVLQDDGRSRWLREVGGESGVAHRAELNVPLSLKVGADIRGGERQHRGSYGRYR